MRIVSLLPAASDIVLAHVLHRTGAAHSGEARRLGST